MSTRLHAWFVLGRSMAAQISTLPFRPLRRALRGDVGGRTLLAAVGPEGYLPLTDGERAGFPSFMRCISCGLCALACPTLRDAPGDAWAEAWSFVVGPSRLLERATIAAASAGPCARCDACAAVCPTGVPIPRLAAMVERLAAAERRLPGTHRSPKSHRHRPHAGPAVSAAMPLLLLLLLMAMPAAAQSGPQRPRARDAGVVVGIFAPGPLDAITDVPGVLVGQVTRVEGDSIHTGVTAILPHPGNIFLDRVPAAIHVGNAFGKLVGSTQVRELGEIETPILLTCTLCVWRAADAMVDWLLRQPGMEDVRSINPVVGETNDGFLNDIRARPIRPRDVVAALEGAKAGPVDEGAVGAGAGTIAFGFKGGIGTASRRLPAAYGGYTVGVLVQTNFGGILTINGAPVGRELGKFAFQQATTAAAAAGSARPRGPAGATDTAPPPVGGSHGAADNGRPGVGLHAAATGRSVAGLDRDGFPADGSCMIVVATDAPLDARNLDRVATRALAGLARTGSSMSNGSGDYVIAFSTAESVRRRPGEAPRTIQDLPNDAMSPLFQAAIEATEEAIYNSLFRAVTIRGDRGTVEALPLDRTLRILEKYHALHQDRTLPPGKR